MTWMSAKAALALLGTKPQTLYANVSRGRIAARPDPGDPRRSLYREEDVERLAARLRGRRPARAVAAESIAWGEPVLETAISTITEGRLLYRGQDAVTLAETATLGAVARLLWSADGEVDFVGRARALTPGMPAAYRAIAELAATDLPSTGRNRAMLLGGTLRAPSRFSRGRWPHRGPARYMNGWRGTGNDRRRQTRYARRWCCWPSMNSMPRPLRRG
jgi:citrate synthase